MKWIAITTVTLSLGGCGRILGLPEPQSLDATNVQDGDLVDIESSCNYLDDDGDGLVDEGFVYVEQPDARHVVDAGTYPGLWWLAKSPDRIAAIWATGEGTAGDVVSIQMFDSMGSPIMDKVSTSGVGQPWSVERPAWIGDDLVFAATQRSYACGGSGSTSCSTYLVGVDRTGSFRLAPTPIATAGPYLTGAFGDQGNYVVAFPGTGVGSIGMRSFTPAGQPGGIDKELFATATGESINAETLRAFVHVDRVFWTYSSSTTGYTLRVTDLAGGPILGPVPLSRDITGVPQRGSDHALVIDGQLVMLFGDALGTAVGWWTLDGSPRFTIRLPGTSAAVSISADDHQLYVLTQHADAQMVPFMQLWRLSLDGRIIEAGTPLPIPDRHTYGAVVSSRAGAVVGVAAASAGSHPVTITRLGCPLP